MAVKYHNVNELCTTLPTNERKKLQSTINNQPQHHMAINKLEYKIESNGFLKLEP